jgi:hypothetical protein
MGGKWEKDKHLEIPLDKERWCFEDYKEKRKTID